MRRREFITFLGGAAAVWPLAARAQLAKPTIGFLDPGVPHVFAGFTDGLRDLGYVEGQNITYVWRSAAGNPNVLPELAAELVALRVDIIATVVDARVLDAVTRVLVDLVERNLLGIRCRRVQRHGAGDERQTQKALPVGSRGHLRRTPFRGWLGFKTIEQRWFRHPSVVAAIYIRKFGELDSA
jgi:hypothetical protein